MGGEIQDYRVSREGGLRWIGIPEAQGWLSC
jgi:hypothetical protein